MRPLKFLLFALLAVALFSCEKKTLFEKVSSSHSGITFNNEIVETDSINPLDVINIYNGGGVGVGDFNNDGLQDIYFTGNAVPNKLYINKGDMKFEDVTAKAGVAGKGGWGRGVAIVDINNDGLKDIYVCNTLLNDPSKRINLLYINQGSGKDGVPVFKEDAKGYGLDINIHSTMAQFFDYDNDGDLDMYLTVNEASVRDNTSTFRELTVDGTSPNTGRLYRNDYNDALKHPVYTNVSKEAGILIEGFGHGTSIVDINRDGWKDIYVTNDFLHNNILYVNNHNGTFTDRSKEYFKHTATAAMGQDIQDINNDGLADVFELDMDPEDNYRKKMFMSATSYQTFQNFDIYKYQYQYNHNTLQLNQGPRVGQNDSIGVPIFSEIAFMGGVAETDWSWCPLITDFDNDGFRDIVVTNGYPRDVTDHDFMVFRNESYSVASKKQVLDQIPIIKIPNYAFRNNGKLQFDNVTKQWGLDEPSFSNGTAYADFDNDGALDMVVNNIDGEAFLYRNTSRDGDEKTNHYLQITFKGDGRNVDGLGAFADVYYDHGKQQMYEHSPYRGYLSTLQGMAHFGLGNVSTVDSVVIKWPDGRKQIMRNVKADQTLKVDIANAKDKYSTGLPALNKGALFTEVTRSLGVNYVHKAEDIIDFNIQKLLPHKLSEYSPAIAVGDIDGNGFDDMAVGGSSKYPAQVLLQQSNGKFTQRDLLPANTFATHYQDEGLLLFDADGDGDLDLYVASGGYGDEPNSKSYQDRVYANDGKGKFTLQADALPANFTSKLCVKAVDYDKNGSLDLFVSGRVEPWSFPKPVSSFILKNVGGKGQIKFADVTPTVAKNLKNVGLVCDASFTDYDNDGWTDLVITGEFMPVMFLKNDHGTFKDATQTTGIADKLGLWNTIAGADFDHDGDIDYIVGNTGLNTFYKATDKYPMYITAKDFDNNGSYDAFPSLFLKDQNGEMKEFPAHTRDDVVKQVISMRIRYQNYKTFATATMDSVLTPEMRKGAIRVKANMMQSVYLRNNGKGKFTMLPLPIEAQVSQLAGIVVDDFDADGNLDVALNGNDYSIDVSTGRYDAFNGLLLKGDGKGGFKPMSILKSGLYIPGDGKALVKLRGADGKYLMAASQYRSPIKIFRLNTPVQSVALKPADMFATIKYKSGKVSKQEFYNGGSFLSQSGRFFNIDRSMAGVSITDNNGRVRTVPIP